MICHSSRELLLYCYEWSNSCHATSHKCTIINFYRTTKVIRQEPRSKFCNTVSFVCNIRSVRLDLINTSIHISLYALCVLPMLLYTIVHWLSFRHMSSHESIGKQAILICGIYSSSVKISVAESQRFLLAKRPKWREARINGCFCRIIPHQLISFTQQLEILAKALPQVNDFLPSVRKTFLELNLFLKFCR